MDLNYHFPESVGEPHSTLTKEVRDKKSPSGTSLSSDNTAAACFDCNICLDFAQDPIVTLCGHLYCWPCIYKWINHKSSSLQQQCPVCKADLSQATIIPLYGRGATPPRIDCSSKGSHLDIPKRPSAANRTTTSQSPYSQLQYQYQPDHESEPEPEPELYHYGHNHIAPTVSFGGGGGSPGLFQLTLGAFGGTATQVLPWVFGYPEHGLYYSNPYNHLSGGVYSPNLRRQVMQPEKSLRRISAFLFCCLVLCLLLF